MVVQIQEETEEGDEDEPMMETEEEEAEIPEDAHTEL